MYIWCKRDTVNRKIYCNIKLVDKNFVWQSDQIHRRHAGITNKTNKLRMMVFEFITNGNVNEAEDVSRQKADTAISSKGYCSHGRECDSMLIRLAHVRTCCCSTKSGVNYSGWKWMRGLSDYKIYRFWIIPILWQGMRGWWNIEINILDRIIVEQKQRYWIMYDYLPREQCTVKCCFDKYGFV